MANAPKLTGGERTTADANTINAEANGERTGDTGSIAVPKYDDQPEPQAAVVAQAPDETPAGHTRVRLLRKGEGKVSTGVHVAGEGDQYYRKGDEFDAPNDSAVELEDRGFVEIV